MKRVLINGLGRSGTTWALKTFDHHPHVFASHEPEQVLMSRTLYKNIFSDDPAKLRTLADGLFNTRGLRAMRRRPIRRKAYRTGAAHVARLAYIYGLSVLGQVHPRLERLLRKVPVPDLADLSNATQVIKTVSMEAGMEKVARLYDDVRFVYIVRHPCGYVASVLNGMDSRHMGITFLPPRPLMKELFGFEKPETLQESDFSTLEIVAYRWAAYCHLNVATAGTLSNLRVMKYEDLCADPIKEFREMFEWCGLDWHPDCEAFLAESLASEADSDDYHGLLRNPLIAANKWRESMPAEDIRRVMNICRHSAAAKLFEDVVTSKTASQRA